MDPRTTDIADRIEYLIELTKRTVGMIANNDSDNIMNGEKLKEAEQDDIITNIVIDKVRTTVGI
nr:MAG TPA: hypothetical protein [Caudoviricetes sp.]